MAPAILLLVREHGEVGEAPGGKLLIRAWGRESTISGLSSAVRAALLRLNGDGVSSEDLSDLVVRAEGRASLPLLHLALAQLGKHRLLRVRATGERGPLATATRVGHLPASPALRLDPERSYVLSRFAHLRREADQIVLECGLSPAKLLIHDSRIPRLLFGRGFAAGGGGPTAGADALSPAELSTLGSLLLQFGLLVERDEKGRAAGENDGALAQWEHHDLLFHAITTGGRRDDPLGGTYRFADRMPPPPPTKPAMSDERLELERPDLEQLWREDVPFTAVLEGRRSRRTFGGSAPTVSQVGEFLYRVGRQRSTFEGDHGLVLSSRPYPAGGALYELEIYLSVGSCRGLARGAYHYCPREHRLSRLGPTPKILEDVLRKHPELADKPPQLLLVIAARFERVLWKYESMGYALVLKDVGVLYQTMYLVAEAMGLAGCAFELDSAPIFASDLSLDWYEEAAVGGFLLGSRAAGQGLSSHDPKAD